MSAFVCVLTWLQNDLVRVFSEWPCLGLVSFETACGQRGHSKAEL